jgi:hypothetical protein
MSPAEAKALLAKLKYVQKQLKSNDPVVLDALVKQIKKELL